MMTDPDVILSEREGPGFETLGTTPDPSGDGTALRMTDPDVILSNAKDLVLRHQDSKNHRVGGGA